MKILAVYTESMCCTHNHTAATIETETRVKDHPAFSVGLREHPQHRVTKIRAEVGVGRML